MRIWPALIVAPMLALLDQSVAFAMVGWSCAHQTEVWLNVVQALFATATGFLAAMAWQEWRSLHETNGRSPLAIQRHFLAGVAVASGTLSMLGVFAMWIAVWMIASCIA